MNATISFFIHQQSYIIPSNQTISQKWSKTDLAVTLIFKTAFFKHKLIPICHKSSKNRKIVIEEISQRGFQYYYNQFFINLNIQEKKCATSKLLNIKLEKMLFFVLTLEIEHFFRNIERFFNLCCIRFSHTNKNKELG